jgi:hypothetical protein
LYHSRSVAKGMVYWWVVTSLADVDVVVATTMVNEVVRFGIHNVVVIY